MQRVKLFPLDSDAPVKVIHFGSMTAREPAQWRQAAGRLELPQYLMRWLGVAPGEAVHAWADPSGEHIHVGPVLGVLLEERDAATLPGGPRAAHCRGVYRAAREAGLLPVFFTVADAAPGKDTISGWADRDGRWIRVQYPVPDVLYGCAGSGSVLEPFGAIPINRTGTLARSDIREALRFFPETREWAASRSAGRESDPGGTLRVTGDRGFWQVTGQFHGSTLREGFSAPDGLFRFLRQLPGGGPESGAGDLVCDLLTVAQKDRHGIWQVPLTSLRRVAVGPVAARVTAASEPLDPDLLPGHFGDRYPGLSGMREAAASVALRTAAALEARFGRLGELGIETGWNAQGRPQVLKVTTDLSRFTARPVATYPFDQAIYLASRAWEGRYSGAPLPSSV